MFKTAAESFRKSNGLLSAQFVGRGAFKETFRVRNRKGKIFALKIYDPEKCDLARSEREINAVRKCNSRLIARLFEYGDFFTEEGKRKFFFCLEEYLSGGTLSERIKKGPLSPKVVRSYALDLTDALEHLETRELVHRDIKPDNIMFRKGVNVPILVDFGIVKDLSQLSLTPTWIPSGPGTPYYAAPEQLLNEKHLIGWRTDQFGVGIVLGICLTGIHPFHKEGMNSVQVVRSVSQRERCTEGFVDRVSSLGLGWLVRMIQPWPHHRFNTIRELKNAIKEQ
ncbi:MAG: serine/threonine-protein kinase [Bacteroidota bacterium]